MKSPLLDHLGYRTDLAGLQFLGEAGFLWSYLGRWTEAMEAFNALVALIPNDPTGHLGIAEVFLMQNKYLDAQRSAEQAARVAITRPNNNAGDRATAARAYVVAGKALVHLGKPQEAKQTMTKAIELDPSGPSGRHAAEMIELGRLVGAVGETGTRK
jgi:tetratricopeptide (TPR) repeat protein